MSEKLAREKRGLSRENIKWLPKASKIPEAGGGIDGCLWEEIRGNCFSEEGFLIVRQCPAFSLSHSLFLPLTQTHILCFSHIGRLLRSTNTLDSCLRSLPHPLPRSPPNG